VCKAWWMQYIRPSHQRRPPLANRTTFEEIKYAIRKGGSNKAPGHDGIGADFYKENWETKMTCAKSWIGCCYTELKQQNHGVVVCLPKPNGTDSRGIPSHHPPEQRLQDPGENYSTAYTPGDGKNNACNANDKPQSWVHHPPVGSVRRRSHEGVRRMFT